MKSTDKSSDNNVVDQTQEVELDSNAQVVIDDIITDSVDKIKEDFKDNSNLQFSELYNAGSAKQYVEKYDEAVEYFIAAADITNDKLADK